MRLRQRQITFLFIVCKVKAFNHPTCWLLLDGDGLPLLYRAQQRNG